MSEHASPEVALYLVPTPIGNKEDITLRALRLLTHVDVVACEDTRTTGRLLSLYNIKANSLVALHSHNEAFSASKVIDRIVAGQSVAYCSDAGTPGISDPGYTLVQEALSRGVRIIPLPGASALTTALVASGMATDSFMFVGFPPHKKGRMTFFDEVVKHEVTVVIYESPFRIASMVEDLAKRCPERQLCIARELTKVFEEFIRGTVAEVHELLSNRAPLKGEIVVILQGKRD